MTKIILLSLMCLIFAPSAAKSENIGDSIAKVLRVSKSNKTIILNRGKARSFEKNEIAYLLGSSKKEIQGQEKAKDVYYPVAKIRLIKERVKSSIWVVTQSFKNKIKKDQKFLFFTLSDFLKGRTPIKIARKKIITNKENQKKNVKESMTQGPDKLSAKKDSYYSSAIEQENNKNIDYDVKLIDVDRSSTVNNTTSSTPIYISPKAAEYQRIKSINTFDKMIYHFLKEANVSDRSGIIERDQIFLTQSQKLENEEVRRDENIKKVSKLYLEKGNSWSDDLSDEELSRVLFQVGELKEIERRKSISAHQFDRQFYLNFGTSFLNNQTASSNQADTTDVNISFAAEFFVLKKFKSINKFTFEVEGRYSKSGVTIGGFNAAQEEYSFAGFINWYPFLNASSLDRNIIFMSLGFRTGFSSLFSSELQEYARYQSLVFPGFRAGIKYNFSNSFGARVYGQIESVELGKTTGSTNFASSTSYTDGKLGISLSRFY